jgi:predicted metal-dependent peptidase
MDIERIKTDLSEKYPPFSDLLQRLQYLDTTYVVTSGTDGQKIIYYNSRILDSEPYPSQVFYIAHSLLHIVFRHAGRQLGKDRALWDKASDAVVNSLLQQDGFTLPENAVFLPSAVGSSTDEVYTVLLQEQTQREEDEEPQPEDPERSDSHDLWSLDPSKLEVSEEDIQAESGLRLSLEELMQQLMEEKKIPGRQTASRIKHLESIGMSYELADLVQYLQESINRDYDWFPGTRIRHGIVNYEFRTFPIPKAEILIDTSLSVDEELLKTFLRACKALLRGAAISVGCFDTRFYGFREIEQESDIDSMQFQGFGGTNFDVAVSAFTGDAENQIIFTDGYADMPHQRCDAIWIVYGNMKISPPGGTVLYIRERGFRERGYR